jgi:outer membrane biosynthesis protein TonB
VFRCRTALICRPPHTEEARRLKVNGFIKVEAIGTTDGRLQDARILNGLSGGLNEQTSSTFKTWRCNPALKDGRPVPTLTSFEVNFRLY